jgi:hypothetical protein
MDYFDSGHAFLAGVAIGTILGVLICVALKDDDDGYNPFYDDWPR